MQQQIKAVSVKLDLDVRTRVGNIAEARHRSPHWVMKEAICQYVDREEKRDAFKKDALIAWYEYQDTGLHATSLDVDAWLASWGTKNELPKPICHK
jgi:predicted transcriptional regulator